MLLYDKDQNVIGRLFDTEQATVNKLYALVIGHQIDEQGAFGNQGIGEYAFNRDLIKEIMDELNDPNLVIFERDKNISGYQNQMAELHERIDIISAMISIEFHFNSFSNEDVRGHEVLYCSGDTSASKEAKKLNDCLDKYLPTSNRGTKPITQGENGGGFVCRGSSISLIIEPYFGASQDDFIVGGKLREPLKNAVKEYLLS